jgi:Type VI secretion system (T6SS), amidase effector protein 4
MSLISADIAVLKTHYPTEEKLTLASNLGGNIGAAIRDHDYETCCIRVSRALNYSGLPVKNFASMSSKGLATGKVRAMTGADSKWYIYSTYDLKVYLTRTYSPPKFFKGDSTAEDVSNEAGIVMFGWRHVDLWDGQNTSRLSMFGRDETKKDGLWIWPVKKPAP